MGFSEKEAKLQSTIEPLYRSVPYALAMEFANQMLGLYENVVYLDSARLDKELANYSFIGFDPFEQFIANTQGNDNSIELLQILDVCLSDFKLQTIPELPPFQGGIAGYLSYDLGRIFEVLPSSASIDLPVPNIAVCAYDLVISMDHFAKKAWIISSGLPEREEVKRLKRAKLRLDWVYAEMVSVIVSPGSTEPRPLGNGDFILRGKAVPGQIMKEAREPYQSLEMDDIQANFTRESYQKAVEKVIDYIRNGDIFQANLSQQFVATLPKGLSAFVLFQQLKRHNAAPFASFINIGPVAIISSSPERFIRIDKEIIETRPIKGTIRRSSIPHEDEQLQEKLINSQKDRAENAMIVDLMRNDLAKICLPGSVKVEKLCGLESFETVHHLVSVIKGRLLPNVGFKALLEALFPGGSITGAPKIRAMEIIEELEPTRRGPYCGSAFYYGFNGSFDSSILIRTYVLSQNTLRFQAGGAIVLDSDAALEYEETLIKASALIKTLITKMKGRHDFTD